MGKHFYCAIVTLFISAICSNARAQNEEPHPEMPELRQLKRAWHFGPWFEVWDAAEKIKGNPQLEKLTLDFVVPHLDSHDAKIRWSALDVIRYATTPSDGGSAMIAGCLMDDSEVVRTEAVRVVARIEKNRKLLIKLLEGRLSDECLAVRVVAIEEVGWIGPNAKAVLPKLRGLLTAPEVPNLRERIVISVAIFRISENEKDVLPILVDALSKSNEDSFAIIDALQGVSEMGLRGYAARACVEVLLYHENAHVRDRAIYCLGKIGFDSFPTASVLQRIADSDPDWIVRARAQSVLSARKK